MCGFLVVEMKMNKFLIIVLLAFTAVSASTEFGSGEEWSGPRFREEPGNRIDFLNERGAAVVCLADGNPTPQIQWLGADNKILTNVDNFRTTLPNSTLLIHPFKPPAYRQDLHHGIVRCLATNKVGSIRSRDVHIRAVIAQEWSARVVASPGVVLKGPSSPLLLRCEVDLVGGGREFIEVSGWKGEGGKFIAKGSQRIYEEEEDDFGHWDILPNGDLVIESPKAQDSGLKVSCTTRHRITGQEMRSPAFTIRFSETPSSEDEPNIPESFPAPIVVRDGEAIVLHCYSGQASRSRVRWQKLSGNSWLDLPPASPPRGLRQIGNSLVAERSSRVQAGHYRCLIGNEKVRELEVRLTEPLSVKLTINQARTPLESTAELSCTITSSSTPSVLWLKDGNLINPGGRIRFFSTNVLQINGVSVEDRGVYQCLGKTELESAQAAVRLELADAVPRVIYGMSEQSLMPGPSISFRCGFSGWPTPTITWFLDNSPLPPSYDQRILIGNVSSHGHLITYLNISETRVEDGGVYSCRAQNRVGLASHSSRLNIYGPLWIRVVPPVVAISGEFFQLNCPISGWPIPFSSVLWEKDGEKLPLSPRHRVGRNGSLSISLVDKSDSGGYWCSVEEAGRTMRREIRVNVVAPLRITPFPEQGRVAEGERFTLVCALSFGDPPLSIQWTLLPREDLIWSRFYSPLSSSFIRGEKGPLFSVLNTDPFTSLLSIQKVSPEHAGKYVCNASSSNFGTVLRSFDLTVLVPPKIESFAFQEGLKEGMMTRLVCGVSQGDLPIQFSWFKDGRPLGKEKGVEISSLDSFSTILRISTLSEDHQGLYTCLAKNGDSGPLSQSYSAKLVVQVAPRWLKEPEDVNMTRGKEAQLDCSGYGIPQPKVSWMKATGEGGGELKWRPVETIWPSQTAQAVSLTNGSLLFYSVDVENEGKYICQISNGLGSGLSKTVHLRVQVPPYFVGSESESISLRQGKTHEISCEAISSSPIYLSWAKGSNVFVNVPANRVHTTVVMEGRRTKSTLVIKDVQIGDQGKYTCSASNSLGKKSRVYNLIVEEQPGAPRNLRESEGKGAEATRVHLEWDAPRESSSDKSFPPILMYVLEFSLQEDKEPFSHSLQVTGDKREARVDNLAPAAQYLFRVRAVNSAGKGAPSEPLLIRTPNVPPAAPPTNGRAQAVGSRGISVSWNPIPQEMTFGTILAYHLLLTPAGGAPERVLVPAAAARAEVSSPNGCCLTVIHGLRPYTHYEIRVAALNTAGSGPLSLSFSVKTKEEAPDKPPRNPQCLSLTSHSIQLSWQHPAEPNGPITSYKVIYHPMDSAGHTLGQQGGETHRTSGLTAVIGGLQASRNYSLHVVPLNGAGEGRESLALFCKTSEDVPSPPSNLIGFPSSPTSFLLSWLPPAKPNGILTHHTIHYRMIDRAADSFEIKRTVTAGLDFHEESGLDLGRWKYVFWVTSSNRMGESGPSPQLIFNPPPTLEMRLVGQSRRIEIQEGNPLILPCRVLGSPEDLGTFPSVQWTLNGRRVVLDGNVYMKPGQTELMFFGVRRGDSGNYSCRLAGKAIKGMEGRKAEELTYRLHVKGLPCPPEPSYKILDREVLILWRVEEGGGQCDAPLGFILYYRALGSILDWKKVIFQPTARNHTLKDITCGSILNGYMVSFNEVGNSPDSHLMSVVVSHSIAPFPPGKELLVPNITSLTLNLQPLNANHTHCPLDKFSLALRERRSSDWLPGKDERIPFQPEYVVEGLRASTSYELTITGYGYSGSRSLTLTFTTLTQFGETPASDLLQENPLAEGDTSFLGTLSLLLPGIAAVFALFLSAIAVLVYCKMRKRLPRLDGEAVGGPGGKPMNDVHYGYLQQRKSFPNHEQLYSGLPCNPGTGLDDISPYATFQISDPKKFHEETFSGEIVVAKFHPVMHGLPRGPRDKWMDGRQIGDSEDSGSETGTSRYAAIPFPYQHNHRIGNLYQINPPPLPFTPIPYPPQQQGEEEGAEGDSSSPDPSTTATRHGTEGRRKHQRERRKSLSKGGGEELTRQQETTNTNHRRHKRRSNNSDYSIAV